MSTNQVITVDLTARTAVDITEIREKLQINMLEIMDLRNLEVELTVANITPKKETTKMRSIENSKMK